MKPKLIPFNLDKAKAGAKVVTRCGYPANIEKYDTDSEYYPLVVRVKEEKYGHTYYYTYHFTVEGKFCVDGKEHELDLFIEEV